MTLHSIQVQFGFSALLCACPVRSNQHSIQCDRCQEWTRVSCAHVSVIFYEQLAAQVQFSWCCPSCLFLELPLNDLSDDVPSATAVAPPVETLPITTDVLCDSISGVRIVHHNVQGLLSKSTDIHE